MFHLGFFTCFASDEWNGPLAGHSASFADGRFHVDTARDLERACFDFVLHEDSLAVPEVFGGSRDVYLEEALVTPEHDPVPLTVAVGAHTPRTGVAATTSTTFHSPFALARLSSTVDGLTPGRFGWNTATSTGDGVAADFGAPQLLDHDDRYDLADEFVDAAEALWNSRDEGAVVMDHATGRCADLARVRPADFRGRWLRTRGPLDTVPSPQRRPVLVQAGASDRGRAFAARNAEVVVATARGIEAMRAYRDDVRARMVESGRDPDSCEVLFLVTPIVGRTGEEARAQHDDLTRTRRHQVDVLARLSAYTGHDLSVHDLDAPLPPIATEGSAGLLARLAQWGSRKSLRQCLAEMGFASDCLDLVGTAESVAEEMAAAMEEVGGDGFLLGAPGFQPSRVHVASITEALVPALQRRGVVRSRSEFETFRQNLPAF
ncbi:NtaA/DmoA family FMN-dependent monooxygenase [Kineococcus rhizosphaerae]|uniref:FMN-dependent oxidoreductase (Nitrilotriacetate monooxygenase family) n=1 Tax=Kineococcus rhizosphaerae TaxID=559628 RepID=A0A2T0R7U8_9ACTN|nr:NtaA/DmoA family FMN-dependent monooxygenase [Kineococcus rhizosphaerae]PRY17222.1 FMN-dependent oxidoreductase (nitrilotriacetate monooxygenase family) [Kineococcus rhizosphaerae]